MAEDLGEQSVSLAKRHICEHGGHDCGALHSESIRGFELVAD